MKISVFLGAILAVGFGLPAFSMDLKPDASIAERVATVAELCEGVKNFSGSGRDCARAMVRVVKENDSGPRLIATACSLFEGINVQSACLLQGAKLTNRKSLVKGQEKCREIEVANPMFRDPTPGLKKRVECMTAVLEAEPDFNQTTASNRDPICAAPRTTKRRFSEQSQGEGEKEGSGGALPAF